MPPFFLAISAAWSMTGREHLVEFVDVGDNFELSLCASNDPIVVVTW